MPKKNSGTTYQYVANDIKNKIINNKYHPGEKLPSMAKLCLEYNTSQTTIKKSLDILKSSGYLVSRHRIGYFIADTPADLFRLKFNISDNLKEPITAIEAFSSTILQEPEAFLAKYGIDKTQVQINKIERFYMHKVLPIALEKIYIATRANMAAQKIDLKKYLHEFDIVLYSHQIDHELRISLLQSAEVAQGLMQADDCLFFKITRVFRQSNKQFVAASVAFIPADVIELSGNHFSSPHCSASSL